MSDKERYFKQLRLISPEEANKVGISSEAPVFISPYAPNFICEHCKIPVGPLVYQTGYLLRAQHFHSDLQEGGIYFNTNPNGLGTVNHAGSKWIVQLMPLGEKIVLPHFGHQISPQVLVGRIQPFCFPCPDLITPLDQGRLIDGSIRGLLPVCSQHDEIPADFIGLNFNRVRNGRINFGVRRF